MSLHMRISIERRPVRLPWIVRVLIASAAPLLLPHQAHGQRQAIAWPTPVFADEPFLTQEPQVKSVLDTELATDFRRCPQEAERRGEYGDLFVDVDYSKGVSVWSTPGIGWRTRRCLEAVGQRLVALKNQQPESWRATTYATDLPVGAPAVLFSDTDGLLLAWRRYLEHPGLWRSWLLKRRLPDEVTLLPHGCLYVGGQLTGVNLSKSLRMWLAQFSAKRIADPWLQALNLRANGDQPLAFLEVFLLTPDLFLKVSDVGFGGRLCLDPITPARRSILRAQIADIDSCFVGDLDRILLTPTTLCPAPKH